MIVQVKDLKTNWGYKTKQGSQFEIIKQDRNAYFKGKDGYSVTQAITNRIKVFEKLTEKDLMKYSHLIWDTSVSNYISHDNESPTMVKTVRNYKLYPVGSQIFSGKNPFIIKGTSPIK